MTGPTYTIAINRSVRRALTETLPFAVAAGAADLFAGPLAIDPHRIGKPLNAPLDGVRSARLMRDWRVLYMIDDERRLVTVRAVVHRRDAYRSR